MSNTRLRCNEQIRISPIRLIDQDKNMIGVISTDEALRMAQDVGMDLVEMSPNERPPVCKIMDYGKHKYDLSKKQKQKHHEQKIKEVRVRPKTDEHDLEIKLKKARQFLEHGDRVQVTMLFRGRERFRQDLAREQFDDIVKELADISKVDRYPRAMGRRMTVLLAPLKVPNPQQQAKKPKPKPKKEEPAKDAGAASGSAPEADAAAPKNDAPPKADVAPETSTEEAADSK